MKQLQLNKNGTLKLADSLLFFKRHKTLTQDETALLLKTMSKVDLLAQDDTNAKLALNSQIDTDTVSYICYLSQNDIAFNFLSQTGTMCPMASPECIRLCLGQFGRAEIGNSIDHARLRKTLYYILFNKEFMSQLEKQVIRLKKKQAKVSKRLAIRLNGTSDVSFARIIMKHPDVIFYDYTAVPKRAVKESQIGNYHVTFSAKENNRNECFKMLHAGINVALPMSKELYDSIGDEIVFHNETFKVVDGSKHDMRFLDPTAPIGYIIKLKEIKSKSKASQDKTDGFIVRSLDQLSQNEKTEVFEKSA